ncbi:MAG: thioredoxin domain-containing protein [Chloroflexota bacterium]|nr:thioredoxin domain-containing protein [Chloroflexota bacterium]
MPLFRFRLPFGIAAFAALLLITLLALSGCQASTEPTVTSSETAVAESPLPSRDRGTETDQAGDLALDSAAPDTGASSRQNGESPATDESGAEAIPQGSNRLSLEMSPYLLQHASNPVDWYPWGEQAFARARQEDKPIFLSIGYSTCHWCHVMEEESFSDPEVARLMNETFVSIKVDREERPDIDNLYMVVCQMLSQSCGWPLNIIMTPDKKPFFATTYMPRETRFGRPGMLEIIPRVQAAWTAERQQVIDSAEQITAVLQQASLSQPGQNLGEETLQAAYDQFAGRFDETWGGFNVEPKFPSPHNLLFLLRYWQRSGDQQALAMVEQTLQSMRRGGVFDQVGYGFHRYSTDRQWKLPHFEKMLYDQAMLAMAYTEAFQATGDPHYQQVAREIMTYLLRDMTSPEGGFYSAEDADSEGEEGKFYLWSEQELFDLLGPQDAELAMRLFNTAPEGNFIEQATGQPTGSNVLHLNADLLELADDLQPSQAEFETRLERIRRQLLSARETRVRPLKDDKILTDWNGLMIAALAKAGAAFGDPFYADQARRAADFLLANLRNEQGRLYHRYRDRQAGIPATLDDYAFLVWGLLELHETTQDVAFLKAALDLNQEMLDHFWDAQSGGLFLTADDGEALLVRQKQLFDGAIPAGNSVAMSNLLRLARITADATLEEKAADLLAAIAGTVAGSPAGFGQLLSGLDFALGPSYEVVIAGVPGAADTEAMLTALRETFVPNKVVLLRPEGVETPEISEIAPYVDDYYSLGGQATAYVCLNYICEQPTTDVDTMLAHLEGTREGP